jgi:hypothetical protein
MASVRCLLALVVARLAGAPVAAIPQISTVHDRLVGEMDYGTPSAGKFVDVRFTLNRSEISEGITGRFSCRPRVRVGPYTGHCALSRGDVVGTRVALPSDAGMPSYYQVTFRASGAGVVCDFTAFAPRLQLGGRGRLYTLDGSYRCVGGAGTTTQAGRFSAVRRRP